MKHGDDNTATRIWTNRVYIKEVKSILNREKTLEEVAKESGLRESTWLQRFGVTLKILGLYYNIRRPELTREVHTFSKGKYYFILSNSQFYLKLINDFENGVPEPVLKEKDTRLISDLRVCDLNEIVIKTLDNYFNK